MTQKIMTIAALIAACFAISIETAQAYNPPSAYQVGRIAKRNQSLKSLRVKTRITGTSAQIHEIGYYDASTKKWKARFLGQNDQELYAYERKLGTNDSLASLLIFESNPKVLTASLKNAGIPIVTEEEILALETEPERRALEKQSIGRLDKKIGWVIGDAQTALWVLKDEFVPLKLLLAGTEVRFEETKPVQGFPYPRSISIYRKDSFVLKGEAMEVMSNPDLADMKAIQAQGLPAIPFSIPSGERALIEQWVQWIR